MILDKCGKRVFGFLNEGTEVEMKADGCERRERRENGRREVLLTCSRVPSSDVKIQQHNMIKYWQEDACILSRLAVLAALSHPSIRLSKVMTGMGAGIC